MKTTDLRIGNYVLIPTNDVIKIPHYPKIIKGIGIFGDLDFTEALYPENHIIHSKDCSGVPLTEEWFLKFGFIFKTKLSGHTGFYKNALYCIKEKDYYALCVAGSSVILAKLKYVHQLQNLYLDLTVEELKYKPI